MSLKSLYSIWSTTLSNEFNEWQSRWNTRPNFLLGRTFCAKKITGFDEHSELKRSWDRTRQVWRRSIRMGLGWNSICEFGMKQTVWHVQLLQNKTWENRPATSRFRSRRKKCWLENLTAYFNVREFICRQYFFVKYLPPCQILIIMCILISTILL